MNYEPPNSFQTVYFCDFTIILFAQYIKSKNASPLSWNRKILIETFESYWPTGLFPRQAYGFCSSEWERERANEQRPSKIEFHYCHF